MAILDPIGDVIAHRPSSMQVPPWAVTRGWHTFLGDLSDDELFAAERDPAGWLAAQPQTPRSLQELASAAHTLIARFEDVSAPASCTPTRHVKKRKQAQIEALCGIAAQRFAGVSRLVDLGSGHGHLTRALAQTLAPEEAVGIDWNAARIARAIDLRGARFEVADATGQIALNASDLVVGLHPCGALGDALVQRARDAHAHVLAVSCCFQKIDRDERRASSDRGRACGFVIPRRALGLANLAPVSFEGSGTLEAKRRWRRTRLALRLALEARGVQLAPGDESRGLTKERVRRGLADIATVAFQSRGLTPATSDELVDAETRAAQTYAHVARFALARHAIGRVLELAIVLDRALLLEEGGWHTEVVTLFSSRTSPRNLAIVALAPEG